MMQFLGAAFAIVALAAGGGGARGAAPATPKIAIGGNCPTWFKGAPALGSGAPVAVKKRGLDRVTVCQFYFPVLGPRPAHPSTDLVGEEIIRDRTAVLSLARAFDRLAPYPQPRRGELRYCPVETGRGFYVRFLYKGGARSSVMAYPSGCRHAVAGRRGSWLFFPGYLERRLANAAPASSRPGT